MNPTIIEMSTAESQQKSLSHGDGMTQLRGPLLRQSLYTT